MSDGTTLPATWTNTNVGELCTALQYGYTASAKLEARGPRFLRITDIQDGSVVWPTVPYCDIESEQIDKFLLCPGDIVFARTGGTVGKSYIITRVPEQSVFASYLIRLTPHHEVLSKFLYHFFQSASYWEQIGFKKGGLQGNVNATTLSTVEIPLCPINEQRRVVAKIEELFSGLDKGVESLTAAREQLKAYRVSVVSAALSGCLTGSDARAWPRHTVGQLVTDVRYGTAKKCTVDPSKTPVLRIPNVAGGHIDLSNLKHTDFDAEELEKLRLEVGDILIVRSNGSVSLVGLSAVVTEEAADYAYAGYLIRLRLDKEKVLPEFLNICLHSLAVRVDIERQARSTSGVHNINSDEIRAISLRIPPLDQQREIVTLLTEKWGHADASETCITTELQRSTALRQSILKKAFSGQLVPQDPADEPASELLKRIRAERDKASANKPERKTKKIRKEKETAR